MRLLTCLALVLFVFSISAKKPPPRPPKKPKHLQEPEQPQQPKSACVEGTSLMSEGHFNLTLSNYEKFLERHKTFILGVQDTKCPRCCDIEIHLKHFKDYLDASKFYKGKPIKLVRVDVSTDRKVLENLNLRVPFVPSVYIYKNKEFTAIPDNQARGLEELVAVTNRVLHPFVILDNEDDVDRFLAFYRLFPEDNPFMFSTGTRKIDNKPTHQPTMKTDMSLSPEFYRRSEIKTRAIAFFEDKNEFADQYKEFKKAALRLATRSDLRVGLVQDPELIKKLHQKHKQDWFGPYERNSLILKRYTGQILKFDILTEKHNFYAWIQRRSLEAIEEYSRQKQLIMDALGMPIIAAFVDPRHNAPTQVVSRNLIQDLKKIAPTLENSFTMTYFTSHEFDSLRERFGIKHRKVPALGIHYYDTIKGHVSYPYDDFSISRIKFWLNSIATGRIFPDSKPQSTDITEFKSLLKQARSLSQASLEDVALKQTDYDLVLLTYNSKSYAKHTYEILGLEYKQLIDWLFNNQISTLMAGTFDFATEHWPQNLKEEYRRKNLLGGGLGIYFLNVQGKELKELKVKNKQPHEFTFNDMVKFCTRSGGVSQPELRKKAGQSEDL